MTQTAPSTDPDLKYTIVVVGGGSAGIAIAARLLRDRPTLDIAIIDPATTHAYQPGWTLVGAGVMKLRDTLEQEGGLIPKGCKWLRAAVSTFQPDSSTLTLEDGRTVGYGRLIVCPGLQLDWDKIEGLSETLGRNGVCSNYSKDTVEYTWTCIQSLAGGTALFTQPPMPIKCAGAPQKIAYLASDHWRKQGTLNRTNVDFCLAGDALFGVAYFRPALQEAVDYYGINLHYKHNLVAVNGPERKATFAVTGPDGKVTKVVKEFDMLHVTPPQSAPDFVKKSPLADAAGWLDVNASTLQHTQYPNVFGIGDVINTSNAKTMAAARAQTPIVAKNVLASLDGRPLSGQYDGYGACPLTVAYGKIVLAEFLYGGKPAPSFPYDQRKPSRFAWFLKTTVFPHVYWDMMLKGRDIEVPHHPDWSKN